MGHQVSETTEAKISQTGENYDRIRLTKRRGFIHEEGLTLVGREGPGADDALCGDSALVGLGLCTCVRGENKVLDPKLYEAGRGAERERRVGGVSAFVLVSCI